MHWIALILENVFHIQNIFKKCVKKFLEALELKNVCQKKFWWKFWKVFLRKISFQFTQTFGSKSAETFFSKSLKKFSNGRMTLIFSFRDPFNLIVWVIKKIISLKCVKQNIFQKIQPPPPSGGGVFIFNVFLTRFGAVC